MALIIHRECEIRIAIEIVIRVIVDADFVNKSVDRVLRGKKRNRGRAVALKSGYQTLQVRWYRRQRESAVLYVERSL